MSLSSTIIMYHLLIDQNLEVDVPIKKLKFSQIPLYLLVENESQCVFISIPAVASSLLRE